jgi:hypothetical protein
MISARVFTEPDVSNDRILRCGAYAGDGHVRLSIYRATRHSYMASKNPFHDKLLGPTYTILAIGVETHLLVFPQGTFHHLAAPNCREMTPQLASLSYSYYVLPRSGAARLPIWQAQPFNFHV